MGRNRSWAPPGALPFIGLSSASSRLFFLLTSSQPSSNSVLCATRTIIMPSEFALQPSRRHRRAELTRSSHPFEGSKHIANKPKDLVKEALSGLVYLNPDLTLTGTTVALSKPNKANVSLLCGGGAGHEPAHAAFVGEGMLTAAVSGQVSSAPSTQRRVGCPTSASELTLRIVSAGLCFS